MATLTVPAAAFVLSKAQTVEYEAKAQVLLSRQNLANALTGTPDSGAIYDFQRVAQTQADIAHTPKVAVRAVTIAGANAPTAGQLLAKSDVSSKVDADLLVFTVTDTKPARAVTLANAFANAYTTYRKVLDTAPLKSADAELEQRISRLKSSPRNSLYNRLLTKQQEIRTLEALQVANASVVRPATSATQTQPRTLRNVMIGLLLGLFLGVAIAFARYALDTRVRTAGEVGELLDLSLLAAISSPTSKGEMASLAMRDAPSSPMAEGFRLLRANLEFASIDGNVKTVLVTSSVALEGKSTTMANLSLAYARAGSRVALIDLDLRRPNVHQLLDLPQTPGATDVAVRSISLDDALHVVELQEPTGAGIDGGYDDGAPTGSLVVLTAGRIPPDPGEFVGTEGLAQVLESLKSRCDIVFIDAPPLLQVGDGLVISRLADAILVVAMLGTVRRPMLRELHRRLESTSTRAVGVVITGAEADEATYGGSYSYGYGYASHERERNADGSAGRLSAGT